MPAPKPLNITAEKLKEMLDYDAQTGDFRWKFSPSPNVRVGDKAGSKTTAGGLAIMIDYRPCAAARLAWIYNYNEEPAALIWHANGDKLDNRLENLQVRAHPKKDRDDISLDRLKADLDYNPDTGVFSWKHSRSGRWTANNSDGLDTCGVLRSDGYIQIGYLSKRYLAHRLAWFYIHGVWPDELIDHINGNRSDNRLCNLRPAKHFQNGQNRTIKSTNTSGMTGIFKRGNRWYARATVNNYTISTSMFKTKEEAIAAREKLVEMHIGEYARSD